MNVTHLVAGAISLVLGVLAVGCGAGTDGAGVSEGPGSRVVSDIIACKAESDCESGETCGDGYCQMKRCSSGQYDSQPPMGQTGYAFTDRALVVAHGNTALDVYSAYAKGGSTITSGAAPLDLAGGNFTGTRPEGVAYVSSGSNDVVVIANGKTSHMNAGFAPIHVASGDTDGDGIDEVVVAGGSQYAVCSALTSKCAGGTVDGTVVDVAVGDLNGDGIDEVLVLGTNILTIIDLNLATISTQPIRSPLTRITAGDLDGDGKADLVGYEPGGIVQNDRLHVYSMLADALAEASQYEYERRYPLNGKVVDLAFARQDDKPILAVLSDSSTLRTYTYANSTLTQVSSDALRNGGATGIAASDINGRSAIVHLKAAKPTVTAGPVVPIAVLTLPPYSTAHSAGTSSATLGTGSSSETGASQGESHTSTVALTYGGGISGNIGKFGANFNVNVTNVMSRGWARSKAKSSSQSVGGSYSISATPDVNGYHSGGVVLAGSCFHRYDYTVEDPAGVLAAKGEDFATYVPIAGETTLWSTARYNALVDAVADGRLPKVTITAKLGDVGSYPSTPSTIDGKPIPAADLVFKTTPVKRASDVGNIGFSLTSGDASTNTATTSFSLGHAVGFSEGVHGGFELFKIGGIDISAAAGQTYDQSNGLDQTYAVTVGSSTTFSGNVPAVKDDPFTPSNEATLYGYSFRPYVYQHHYTMKDGTQSAFYALTYTAGE